MPSPAGDAQGLELAERFLRRLRTDPNFAQTFHDDPATALQDQFPELRTLSKDRVLESIRAAAGTAPVRDALAGKAVMQAESSLTDAPTGTAVDYLIGPAVREPRPA